MGSRQMPTQCPHGRVVDWGDFGDDDETEPCPHCDYTPEAYQQPVHEPFDIYVVHAHLYRAEDDDPPPGISLIVHARVWRTDDVEADAERACEQALRDLRPHLNNSTHIKTLAVLS